MMGDKVGPREVMRGFLTQELARKKEQLERLTGAVAEDKRELSDIEWCMSARASLDKVLNWPAGEPYTEGQQLSGGATKYAGRPGKWKGRHGYEFVAAILAILAREQCTITAAIDQLQKDDPKKWCGEPRNLARRFSGVRKYWEPWFRLMAEVEARERALAEKSRP